jgi:hypothetical protein
MDEIDKQAKKDLPGHVSVSTEFVDAVREFADEYRMEARAGIKRKAAETILSMLDQMEGGGK